MPVRLLKDPLDCYDHTARNEPADAAAGD